jgi:peptidoglycan/LPS O-acetylase OafA/YrhL
MESRGGRLSALDGVRALAIAAVVAFHADLAWIPGGFLGVEVFFVLSGYLVGGALFVKAAQGQRGTRAFLEKRARRLLPGLGACVAVIGPVVFWAYPDQISHWWRGGISSLSGTANWAELFGQRDYFAQSGRGAVFGHFWSLGVEIQAYVLLALLVPALWRVVAFRAAEVFMLLAACSYGWQAVVATRAADAGGFGGGHAYFGTDTRIGAVFVGVAVAGCVQRSQGRSTKVSLAFKQTVAEVTVLAALAGLGFVFVRVEGTDLSLYRGWFVFTAVCTALLIGGSVAGSGVGRWLLGSKPLQWLGTRSYGVYLWHWPVFVLTRPIAGVPLQVGPLAIRLILIGVLSEVSYRWLETSAAVRTPQTRFSRSSRGSRSTRSSWAVTRVGVRRVGELVAAATVGCVGTVVFVSSTAAPASVGQPIPVVSTSVAASVVVPVGSPVGVPVGVPGSVVGTIPVSSSSMVASSSLVPSSSMVPSTTLPPLGFNPADVTIIGDSVLQAASPALRSRLGESVIIDAKVGRQFVEAGRLVEVLRTEGRLRPIVVVALGTNGPFTDASVDRLVAQLSDRDLVAFVMVNAPRRWEGKVNQTLRRAQERHPNVIVIDWPSVVRDRRLRLPDGVHPAPVAASVYAELLVGAVGGSVQAWPTSVAP